MKVLPGDSVVDQGRDVGIAESRSGSTLTIRFPSHANGREKRHRSEVRHLAEQIFGAKNEGRPRQLRGASISLRGDSTLADLVTLFGYSTGQMRSESLNRVLRQLERAGLQITTRSGLWGRDDRFILTVAPVSDEGSSSVGENDPDNGETAGDPLTGSVTIPDPFWPTVLGLPPVRELEFLRALTLNDPILCVLFAPEDAQVMTWLPGTWEGLVGWAYRSAQHFLWRHEFVLEPCRLQVGTVSLIHTYLRPTMLNEHAPQLLDAPRCLNLVTIKRDAELPNDFERFAAIWPGPVFEFRLEYGPNSQPTEDIKAINNCLRIVSGNALQPDVTETPLRVLNWARKSYTQLLSRAVASWGNVVSSKELKNFKGSNESVTALALKAHVASWVRGLEVDADLCFEESDDDYGADPEGPVIRQRIDLQVNGLGHFEIESLNGSGPMESFYQRKIFSRIQAAPTKPFWLVVPNDALLWAGPYLADLASHMGEEGHVILPAANGKVIEVEGKPLAAQTIDEFDPTPRSRDDIKDSVPAESAITLKDVAGYSEARKQIEGLIIWSERHRALLQGTSKSSGILFFGPPGCGKSRWARAIAGELKQEVRLLAPSDLRGAYLGWGQVMIREQFNWLAENSSRMLIIDELDAVARSRRNRQMHTDDMASVNELLVQIDRVLRLGSLIVGTTNFVASLDEALTRSGRFGRYIPIGPPDLEESVRMLMYYLEKLSAQCGRGSRILITVPEEPCVRSILEPMFRENSGTKNHLCGADLEEAVNRAYLSCARAAVPDGGWENNSEALSVSLTAEELDRSLSEVLLSVTVGMMRRFRKDITKYCGKRATEFYRDRDCR